MTPVLFNDMQWLTPDAGGTHTSNPGEAITSFEERFGKYGKVVLYAFNEVDPFECLGEINKDEYVGYAKRFLKLTDGIVLEGVSQKEIEDFVRKSFHPDQLTKGFVSERDILAISLKIFELLREGV